MNKRFLRSTSAFVMIVGFNGLICVPQSQAALPSAITPPVAQRVDDNGIELFTLRPLVERPEFAIGSRSSGISRGTSTLSYSFADNFYGTLNATAASGNSYLTVTLGNFSEKFLNVSGVYTPVSGGVDTFTCVGNICTFTLKDGTQATYDKTLISNYGMLANSGAVTTIAKPDGEVVRMTYRIAADFDPSGVKTARSLKAVYSSLGWMLKYQVDDPSDPRSIIYTKSIDAINTSVDYCDPNAEGCAGFSQTWVHVDGGTNALGYTFSAPYIDVSDKTTKVVTPTGVTKTFVFNPPAPLIAGTLVAVKIDTSTWNYASVTSGNIKTITVTNPDTTTHVVVMDQSLKQIISDADELGRITKYTYDANGRLYQVISPDATFSGSTPTGGYTQYGYDGRGNISSETTVAKAGSGLANLVTSSIYPSTCSNVKTCNKPTSVTDPNGVTTTYTYDSNSGAVATITTPAVGGVASQTRYTYAQQTPFVKNSGGALVASTPVWRLAETSSCMSGNAPACVGTADEVKTVITYGTNNVQPLTVTRKLGDNTLSTTTTYTYDNFGNVLSEDGPITGADDTTYFFYDVLNRRVGVIGPDPDGTGALQRRAYRTTYNGDNKIIAVERGAAVGVNVSALNTMTVLDKSASEFSTTTGLQIASKFYTGTNVTPTQVTEASYDSMLQITCTAERLNPAVFGALPASACSLGTAGVDGADKIMKYTFDGSGALLKRTSAYGTPLQADVLTRTFNTNGTVATLADAKGNRTTLSYDGFNRRIKACVPTAANGAVSSTTDCEQVGYTGSRKSSVTLRDGQTINFGYNAAGLSSSKSGAMSEAVTYNNFGQVKTRTNNGLTETYTYNGFGKMLSDAQPLGTVNYEYDTFGRRSKMIYPASGGASFYVSYSYYFDGTLLNEKVSYNGATPVTQLTFNKDSYGRRTGLYRGPSSYPVSTILGYDASSHLNSIGHNIGGTSYDNTISYSFSSDDRVTKRTNSNGAFDYGVPLPTTINKTYDGLNRDATIVSMAGYDLRGNMTSDGSVTYNYNVNNLLVGSSAGAALTYDAQNRLLDVTKSGLSTRFLYDGADLIAEYNGSNALLRRYVHGAGLDEPLLWYEGTGDTQLRYLMSDDQGSIIGVTDSAGTSLAANTYDAYGAAGAGNLGRFQYTGQSYLSEIGLYNYKNRMYSQTFGRFMQADPIGYGDGMNLYTYVNGDPVNRIDPWGLAGAPAGTPGGTCNTNCPDEIIVVGGGGDDLGLGGGGHGEPLRRQHAQPGGMHIMASVIDYNEEPVEVIVWTRQDKENRWRCETDPNCYHERQPYEDKPVTRGDLEELLRKRDRQDKEEDECREAWDQAGRTIRKQWEWMPFIGPLIGDDREQQIHREGREKCEAKD